jgi:uncharacterized protein (DUF362 family)
VKKTDVYITKIVDDDLEGSLSRQLDFMKIPEGVKSIGIKLNLCDYKKFETATTTDPAVLDAFLKLLRERYSSADIFVFENDATGTLTDNIFPYLGISQVAEKHGIRWVNLSRGEWFPKKIDGYHFKELDVSRVVEECDYVINHPKLKTHSRTKITVGLKNMYSLFKYKRKVEYHRFLDDAIVDINLANKVDYTLVDGFLAHEGNRGPINGTMKKVGLFIGGADIVAVDTLCARLMKFHPNFIAHIRKAQKKKIGSMQYTLRGDLEKKDFKDYRFEYSLVRYFVMNFARRIFAS